MKLAERLHTFVVKQKCVPWSVGQRFDKWLETDARNQWPAVYQFAHFRRVRDIARPVTRGTAHHFFGYYEKSPWNASGGLLAAHEVDFNDRPPGADDRARIGLVHLADGARFQPLAETRTWNWQQGSMLQWHPADAEAAFTAQR